MSFIDKRGNFFGRINIIDFVCTIILTCVVILLYPRIQKLFVLEAQCIVKTTANIAKIILSPAPAPVPAVTPVPATQSPVEETSRFDARKLPTQQKNIKVRFSGYSAEVARTVMVGDHDTEIPSTMITDIISITPFMQTTPLGVTYPDPNLKSIIVSIQAFVGVSGNAQYYRGDPLKIGGFFLLITNKYNMNGEVIQIGDPSVEISCAYEKDIPKKEIDLKVRFSGYRDEVVRAARVGDQDIEEPGTMIRSIGPIRSIQPMILTTHEGVKYTEPHVKSLEVKIRARVGYDGEMYYYKRRPLKLGSLFLFKTRKYDMCGEVLKIE